MDEMEETTASERVSRPPTVVNDVPHVVEEAVERKGGFAIGDRIKLSSGDTEKTEEKISQEGEDDDHHHHDVKMMMDGDSKYKRQGENGDDDHDDDASSMPDADSVSSELSNPQTSASYYSKSDPFFQKDARVKCMQVTVVIVLLAAAIASCTVVYLSIYQSEKDEFETRFRDQSNHVFHALHAELNNKFAAIDSLGIAIQSYANSQRDAGRYWPTITMPEFEYRAVSVLGIGRGTSIALHPIVKREQQNQWANYSVRNQNWRADGIAFLEMFPQALGGGGGGGHGGGHGGHRKRRQRSLQEISELGMMMDHGSMDNHDNTMEGHNGMGGDGNDHHDQMTMDHERKEYRPIAENVFQVVDGIPALADGEIVMPLWQHMPAHNGFPWVNFDIHTDPKSIDAIEAVWSSNQAVIAPYFELSDGDEGHNFPYIKDEYKKDEHFHFHDQQRRRLQNGHHDTNHGTTNTDPPMDMDHSTTQGDDMDHGGGDMDHGSGMNMDHGSSTNMDHSGEMTMDHGGGTNMDHSRGMNMDHGGGHGGQSGPASTIWYPLFDSFRSNRTLVAMMGMTVRWDSFFYSSLPPDPNGLFVVISNTCGQVISFEITGPEVIYLGPEDYHEPEYEAYKRVAHLSNSGSTFTNIPLRNDFCPYTVEVYPSAQMEEAFHDMKPLIFTVGVGGIFIFTIFVFGIYALSVYRRQTFLAEKAKRDHAVGAMGRELRQLVDTANAPIFGIDIDGNVNEWNYKTAEITGFPKDVAMGKPLVSTFIVPNLRESVNIVLNNALKGRETSNYSLEFRTKSNKIRYLLVNATTRRDDDGEIVGVVGVAQDVTDDRKKSQALREMQYMRASQEAKVETERNMTAYFAHELRNPLHAIDSALKLMPDDITEDAKSLVSAMNECTSFMASIMNNLLDVRKMEEGKMELTLAPLSLSSLAENVCNMLRVSKNPNVKMTCNWDLNNRDWTLGDSHRIQQVLTNVITNAIKHTTSGYINLSMKWVKEVLHFRCEDSGTGIPMENQSKLCQRFVQCGGAPGSGLGLAIAKQVVDLFGGSITFESDPSVKPGTTCIIQLPLKQCNPPHCDSNKKKAPDQAQLIEEKVSFLLIDDIAMNRTMFKRRIKKGIAPNAVIKEAPTGEKALEILEDQRFDFIIVDQHMEGAGGTMLGTEAVVEMRKRDVKSIIIGCSGNDINDEFMDAGSDWVIGKPTPPNPVLLENLRRLMLQ